MGDENERSSSSPSTRKLRDGAVNRIRERASKQRSGIDGRSNSGGSSGDNGNSDTDTTGSANILGDASGIEADPDRDNGNASGIKITGGTGNRGSNSGTRNNSGGIASGGTGDSTYTDAELVTETPSRIKVTEIFTNAGPKPRGRKPGSKNVKVNVSDDVILPLKIAVGFIFDIPVYLGWGKHWGLTDEENDSLSNSIRDVLEAFPSSTTVDFLKALDKWMPILTLGITLYSIVEIRLKQTSQLMKEKKFAAENEQREESAASGNRKEYLS